MVVTVLMNLYINNKASDISIQKITLNDVNRASIDFTPVMYRLYYNYRNINSPYLHVFDGIMLTYAGESFNRLVYITEENNFNNYIKFSIDEDILNMHISIPNDNIDSKYSINLSKNFGDLTVSEFIDQTSSLLYNYFTLTIDNVDIITKLHDYNIKITYGLSTKNKLLITEDEYSIIMMERMLNNGQEG